MARTDLTFLASASVLLLFLTRSADVNADRENPANRPSRTVSPQYPDGDERDHGNGDGMVTGHRFPKTWVANMFYDTLSNFTVSKNVGSSACQKQTQMYISHLGNDSLWAVQMSDSWSRYPNGILVGTSYQMGVYDECIDVHHPVQGKYCLPQITLVSANGENSKVGHYVELQNYDHAWSEILEFVDNDQHIRRNVIKFGICIPDSCTASDLEISLQKEFDKRFLPSQVKALVKVDSILCTTGKEIYPHDTGYYLISIIVGLIVLICCLSTAYHLIIIIQSNNGKKNYKMPEVFRSFSIIRNFRDLIKYEKDNSLNIFNGIKVYAMVLILFGHKFLYFIVNPIMYGKGIEKAYKGGSAFLLTGMNFVDVFFYMSGFLMYFMLIKQFRNPKTTWIKIPMVIIYKYLRTLPVYVVVMLLTAFVIPHLGNGPFWAYKIWSEADKCRNYWWANLLVISNFIEVDNQCLIAGWYISCLIQFLAIGTVLIYILAKNQKFGTCLIILMLCVSLIIPFVLTYINKVYGLVRVMNVFFENPANSLEFQKFYRPFYLRGIPYYAGILAGIVVEELNKRKIKFSLFVVYVGTVVIYFSCISIQSYGGLFYDLSRPYSALEQSFYATFSHCTWTTILSWITICHFTSGYGPIEKLFNNRLIIPLGRLSYTVYIINITMMIMIESRQRSLVYPSDEVIIDGWIFSSFRTYLMATILHLFVDAPFGLLIKQLIFRNVKSLNNTSTRIENTTNSTETTEQKDSTHF